MGWVVGWEVFDFCRGVRLGFICYICVLIEQKVVL